MRFGTLDLSIIGGGDLLLDGGAMFGVVPKVLWEKKFPADERNRIRLTTNCLLVRGKDFTVLVETGLGDKFDAKSREIYGLAEEAPLEAELAREGVGIEDVDAVVVSYLHFDHAGGSTRRVGDRIVPAFPNARLFVQEAELEHARSPNERDRASYDPVNWEPWAQAGRLEAVSGEREIRPGVSVVPVAGHNEGMQAVRIESAGKTCFYFADALPTAAHLPVPWIMGHDLFPVELIQNKKRLTDEAAREGWLCVFEHDPVIPWGVIVDELSGRRRVHVVPRDAAFF
jgi:glyoxylase-like metal-dependent hydrolase (beta-lactamase superfamily II)